MEIDLSWDTCLIGMIESEMVGSWIHLIGGLMVEGYILVSAQRDNIINIYIGVRSSTFQRTLRKQSHLHLMEK